VAHKEVHKGDLKDASLMREISTIRARPHANIVKIFAGFFAGRENPWHEKDYEQSLHILFEHTDGGNMRNWLELSEASQPPMDNATRRQHIIDTIEGLVHAVMCIHRTFKTHVGYHHDLKPANILLFPTPSPIWKICDFGMANLKHSDDSETTHNDQKGFGTYTYQPPEYFSSGSPSGHGRPFDVWSLGCIILELLTVWHFGWAETGIATFRQWRKENTELASPNRSKLGQSATDDCSFHNNFNVVKKWIAHLSEKGSKDNEFLQVLGLVSEMLVEDKNARIFIWEVYMDLYEMVNPDMTAQELKEHYRTNVVQPSVKSLNGISTGHNPLVRAKGLGKEWQVEVLSNSQNQWFDGKPEQTDTLKNLPRRSTGLYYSTLSGCQQTHDFDRTDFYGRHDMDVKISEGFRELNCVGLYGMSGIGYYISLLEFRQR
jgi:serine/threonine protein kinase